MKARYYKQVIEEMKICKPALDRFYEGEIKGTELFSFIMENAPAMRSNWEQAFVDFCSQINQDKFFDSSWRLPKDSSGSFYTAFFDLDIMESDEYLTEEEFRYLTEEWTKI